MVLIRVFWKKKDEGINVAGRIAAENSSNMHNITNEPPKPSPACTSETPTVSRQANHITQEVLVT